MRPDQAAALLRRLRPVRRVAVILLFVSIPFASAILALRVAPPAHVEIAGQPVAVKPVLGQDTSRLQSGALIRPEHAHLGLLGTDVGVDISANWNQLIPSDKQTRQYLIALWDDPQPEIERIRRAARDYVITWSLIGFLTGAVVSGGVALLLRERQRRLATYTPEQRDLVLAHNRRLRVSLVTAGVVGALALNAAGLATYLHRDHHEVVSNPVFAGTTLEGTEVNGLMSEVLPFLSILRPKDTFYDTVSRNLEEALADRDDLRRHGERMSFVLAEDFEDVNGMARQVGLAARAGRRGLPGDHRRSHLRRQADRELHHRHAQLLLQGPAGLLRAGTPRHRGHRPGRALAWLARRRRPHPDDRRPHPARRGRPTHLPHRRLRRGGRPA